MSISILYHLDFLNHDTGAGHPECPDRLRSCVSALKSCEFSAQLNWKDPRFVTVDELEWIHTKKHIKHIKSVCDSGGGYMDPDTPVCPESYNIALKSAGAWLDGVDEVIEGVQPLYYLDHPDIMLNLTERWDSAFFQMLLWPPLMP